MLVTKANSIEFFRASKGSAGAPQPHGGISILNVSALGNELREMRQRAGATSGPERQTDAYEMPPLRVCLDTYRHLGSVVKIAKTVTGQAEVITYLHADLLGSPTQSSSPAGANLTVEQYAPYGEKLNGVAGRLGYTGHVHDFESGLTYMQARFYDAQVGRFLSADPVVTSPRI